MDGEVAVLEFPLEIELILLLDWSVIVPPPFAAVAVWKKFLNEEPVLAEPILDIVALYV